MSQSQLSEFGSRNETITARSSAARIMPSEFLVELQAAASMIMTREECAAIEQELLQLRAVRCLAA
jgi:hypothetical protein